MKRAILVLGIMATVLAVLAQGYNYQAWQPSMGPLNFNTLGDAQHPYAQCKYGSSYNNPTSIGISGSGTAASHAIVTQYIDDPCRCYQVGSSYIHEKYLPIDWSGTPGSHQDTAIRIGCGTSNSTCNKAAQIEYWFYPEDSLSTLLVLFSFAIQNVNSTHDAATGCGSLRNPQFYIEVYDGETNQLLNIGYYPTKASQQTANPVANPNWPYSKFLAWPSGCGTSGDSQNPSDSYGITTYYWAGQNSYGYATPTTFPYRECPGSQTGGSSSSYPVEWFEYKPLAFNLSAQASQNVDLNGNFTPQKSVKLRIYTYGCSATAHWAYGLFTAKMIPGAIQVDACGGDDIHLSVPWGFLEQTYEWHYGYDSLDAKNKILDLSSPLPGITPVGQTDVFINRDTARVWPYYRCEMRSYTGVPFIYEAHVKSYYIEPDYTFTQNFNNCDLSIQLQDNSTIYTVVPPTQQGGTEDTVYQQTQFIQWFVKKYNTFVPIAQNVLDPTFVFDSTTITPDGEATFKIVVQDEDQKCIDTIVKTIQLDMSAIEKVFGKDTVKTCEEKLPYVYDPNYFGDTQSWSTEGTRRVNYEGLAWNGCDSLVDVTLLIQKPKVDIVFDLDYCDEFKTTLSASTEENVAEYKWSTGEITPSITITAPGTYSVEIVSEEGCGANNSITIPACKPFLNLPNTITPSNIDGVNDYFYIPQRNLIESLEFTVFNRNGEMIYHTTNKDFEWNGTENGKLFVGATYTYTLRITDYEGVSSTHKGSITIL